jgi:hypothetical protein
MEPTSPQRSIFLTLRNRAPSVSRPAISPHAGRSPMHRSTAVALLRAGCKQCDRPAMRMTIGRIGSAVHRTIYGFDIGGFISALRSTTEVYRTSRRFALVPGAAIPAHLGGSRPTLMVSRRLTGDRTLRFQLQTGGQQRRSLRMQQRRRGPHGGLAVVRGIYKRSKDW